jgi:hypothetical protein
MRALDGIEGPVRLKKGGHLLSSEIPLEGLAL